MFAVFHSTGVRGGDGGQKKQDGVYNLGDRRHLDFFWSSWFAVPFTVPLGRRLLGTAWQERELLLQAAQAAHLGRLVSREQLLHLLNGGCDVLFAQTVLGRGRRAEPVGKGLPTAGSAPQKTDQLKGTFFWLAWEWKAQLVLGATKDLSIYLNPVFITGGP